MKFFLILLTLLVVHPGFAQDEDQEILDELIERREQQSQLYQKINPLESASNDVPLNLEQELKKLGHADLDMNALSDAKVVELLKHFIRSTYASQTDNDKFKKLNRLKLKEHPFGKFLQRYPRLFEKMVNVISDKEAILALLDIFPRKEAIRFFLFCSVGLLIFGMIFKRFLVSKDTSFFTSLLLTIIIQLFLAYISLKLFYYIFERELAPTFKILGL
jgi:hypothetical protein